MNNKSTVRVMTPYGWRSVASDTALNGAYIAWLLTRESAHSFASWMKFVGIPDPVPAEELHSTVMYSPEHSISTEMHGDMDMPMPVSVVSHKRKTSIFGMDDSKPGAIVCEFENAPIVSRHAWWRDNYMLQHSFPTFAPHVTMSYNARACPADVLDRIINFPYRQPIAFDRERRSWCNQ